MMITLIAPGADWFCTCIQLAGVSVLVIIADLTNDVTNDLINLGGR